MSRVKIEIESLPVMIAELYDQEAPKTVENFKKLVRDGYYSDEGMKVGENTVRGNTFHRIVPGFVAQGGCPRANGTGSLGYTIDCETKGGKQYHDVGVLSMAHAGTNTGCCQFFICHSRQQTQHLDGKHTCFGRVVEGLEAIPMINNNQKMKITLLED